MTEKEIYKDCKTENKRWKVMLLGDYAIQKIFEIHGTDVVKKPIVSLNNYCRDKRRIPTVRKFLEKENLIYPSWNTNDFFQFLPDTIEKILPSFSKEPEFDIKGYVVKESYYLPHEHIPLKNRRKLYKVVRRLNAYEAIHIYLNQKDYDIRVFKTTYKNSKRSTYTEYFSLEVFPLKLIQEADKNILDANINDYIKKNAGEILTETFETQFNCIKNERPFLSLKDVSERLSKVQEKIRHLQYVEKELSILETKFIEKGDEECTKTIFEKGYEYVKERAPLWITDDNTDNKELAEMILKGIPLIIENTVNR